jgi:hypothetical protein
MNMENPATNSDLAALLQQIDAETRAAHAAMHDFRAGEARHAFIMARMERTQRLATQLIQVAGSEAIPAIISTIDNALSLRPSSSPES